MKNNLSTYIIFIFIFTTSGCSRTTIRNAQNNKNKQNNIQSEIIKKQPKIAAITKRKMKNHVRYLKKEIASIDQCLYNISITHQNESKITKYSSGKPIVNNNNNNLNQNRNTKSSQYKLELLKRKFKLIDYALSLIEFLYLEKNLPIETKTQLQKMTNEMNEQKKDVEAQMMPYKNHNLYDSDFDDFDNSKKYNGLYKYKSNHKSKKKTQQKWPPFNNKKIIKSLKGYPFRNTLILNAYQENKTNHQDFKKNHAKDYAKLYKCLIESGHYIHKSKVDGSEDEEFEENKSEKLFRKETIPLLIKIIKKDEIEDGQQITLLRKINFSGILYNVTPGIRNIDILDKIDGLSEVFKQYVKKSSNISKDMLDFFYKNPEERPIPFNILLKEVDALTFIGKKTFIEVKTFNNPDDDEKTKNKMADKLAQQLILNYKIAKLMDGYVLSNIVVNYKDNGPLIFSNNQFDTAIKHNDNGQCIMRKILLRIDEIIIKKQINQQDFFERFIPTISYCNTENKDNHKLIDVDICNYNNKTKWLDAENYPVFKYNPISTPKTTDEKYPFSDEQKEQNLANTTKKRDQYEIIKMSKTRNRFYKRCRKNRINSLGVDKYWSMKVLEDIQTSNKNKKIPYNYDTSTNNIRDQTDNNKNINNNNGLSNDDDNYDHDYDNNNKNNYFITDISNQINNCKENANNSNNKSSTNDDNSDKSNKNNGNGNDPTNIDRNNEEESISKINNAAKGNPTMSKKNKNKNKKKNKKNKKNKNKKNKNKNKNKKNKKNKNSWTPLSKWNSN